MRQCAILSWLIQWINGSRHRASTASAVPLALAYPQGQTLYGQNDDIEFRRASCTNSLQFSRGADMCR